MCARPDEDSQPWQPTYEPSSILAVRDKTIYEEVTVRGNYDLSSIYTGEASATESVETVQNQRETDLSRREGELHVEVNADVSRSSGKHYTSLPRLGWTVPRNLLVEHAVDICGTQQVTACCTPVHPWITLFGRPPP